MDAITALSALDLSAAIHGGQLSCQTVMEAYLARIERLNPMINAIVSLHDRASLLAEADTADAILRDGHSRGWMHGMPIAVKDLSDAKGLRSTYGSPLHVHTVPEEDSIHVGRMRAAGAIFIGKTNTPEFGLGSHTYNPVFGPTRNPIDLDCSVGGSSGGAAAALAAHLVPVADGSDMMGSLRNPAAFNAIVGFRPSFGRVPDEEGDLFLGQLSVVGPMGRTVADVAALLATQAGYDRRVPLSLEGETQTFLESEPVLRHGKVGWLGDFDGYLPFENGILDLCGSSLATFEAMGAKVEAVSSGFDMTALWQSWCTLRHILVGGSLQTEYTDPDQLARMKPEALWEIESAKTLSAHDLYAASRVRSEWYRYISRLFDRYDALILPTAQVFPFDVGLDWPKSIAGRRMDTYHRWMEVVIGPSMVGLPVAAMPAGFSSSGLPAGIQIIGPPRGDMATLRIAAAYERHYTPEQRRFDQRLNILE